MAPGDTFTINEFSVSTTGADVEYIEILATPNADLSGWFILGIEGDSTSAVGTVDAVIDLAGQVADANGFYVANVTANTFENGSSTLLLVSGFSGSAGDDLDADNDGTFDTTPWTEIIDDVSIDDGDGMSFSSTVLDQFFDGAVLVNTFAPGGASRIPNGADTNTAADWVRNDFDLVGIDGFAGTAEVGKATNTPGAANLPVVFINEFSVSTTGTDVEYVELISLPATDLTGWFILQIEGDSPNAGIIDAVIDLSGEVTDTNGLYLANVAANTFENGSATLLLVNGFTGSLGQDLDAAGDGALDTTPWSVVGDSVAVNDGGVGDATYSASVLDADFDSATVTSAFAPGGASRIPDGVSTNSAADWVRNDFDLAGIEGFTGTPVAGEALNTPGAFNEAVATDTVATPVTIMQVQGAGHVSPELGNLVQTTGIVTLLDVNGFYMQDPTGDGDDLTSDGIFVFTSSAPTVSVGDAVTVEGTAAEFFFGETQITATSVTFESGGNALPDALVVSTDSSADRVVPSVRVDDAGSVTFDPTIDARDFYESLEGMLVTVPNAQAVSDEDTRGSFGEFYVISLDGNPGLLNDRGGITIAADVDPDNPLHADLNPERIQVDPVPFSDARPAIPVEMGDLVSNDGAGGITGVIAYEFSDYSIRPNAQVVTTEGVYAPEETTLVASNGHLTVATFNVLNLDPTDAFVDDSPRDPTSPRNRFDQLADQIVNNLHAPNIIGLQEIQDNSGATDDGVTSADQTLQTLIDSIMDAGGPTYSFIDNIFIGNNTNGGEPGGNIRTAFLYDTTAVSLVADSVFSIDQSGQQVFDPALIGTAQTDPTSPFFDSRLPLGATFEFGSNAITIINNHFPSKGGSDALFGDTQPPVNGQEDLRTEIAALVNMVVDDLLAADSDANIIVLGDLNEFQFFEPLTVLAGSDADKVLTNLADTVADPSDIYTFEFEGNSQALDHILVSDALLAQGSPQVDYVHLNTGVLFETLVSDHDPIVASFDFTQPSSVGLDFYVRVGRYDLPTPANTAAPAGSELASEASAVTYNWDTDTLFLVGDQGTSIVQVSKTGALIDSMTVAAGLFDDTEGVTYLGGGEFAIVEERLRTVNKFTYTADAALESGDVQKVDLGTDIGNIGLEGLTRDALSGGFVFVKEAMPQGVFESTVDFASGTASNGSSTTENSVNLFDLALLQLNDLSDVFALSELPALAGTGAADNLIILSQESGVIVEVDRTDGTVLSRLTLQQDDDNLLSVVDQGHEGVTFDRDGFLYVVSEQGGGADTPQLWVFQVADFDNAAPTAIAIENGITTLPENASTDQRIRLGDVVVSDDGIGPNELSISGADADLFSVDATGLYLNACATLDFETQTSYSITVEIDDPTLGGTPDASTPFVLSITDIVNESGVQSAFITEAAPWSSGNSPVGADWFELTNSGPETLDIAGWRFDDDSADFGASDPLENVTALVPGESAIFIDASAESFAETRAAFVDNWFGGLAPTGLQIGYYDGAGLGTGGDGIYLFDAAGTVQTSLLFGASPSDSPFATFDNSAEVSDDATNTLSEVGVGGAFEITNGDGAIEIGSPGYSGKVFVSETAPWSSGDSPVDEDWFELSNTSSVTVDITGWRFDDDSVDFAASDPLEGITELAPGESVIFLNVDAAGFDTVRAAFIDNWFDGSAPAGLQIGYYDGSGLGTGGDGVFLFDALGNLQTGLSFGASTEPPALATFDNSSGLEYAVTSHLSMLGFTGVFEITSTEGLTETGSPGTLAGRDTLPSDVASGDVTADSVVLWTRSLTLGTVTFDVATDAAFSNVVATIDETVTDILLPVKVEVDGLDAHTEYWYRTTDASGTYKTGTFDTAALPGEHTGLTFGVSGDWRGDLSVFPAVKNAAEANLDFFLAEGDTIYADVPSPAVRQKPWTSTGPSMQRSMASNLVRTSWVTCAVLPHSSRRSTIMKSPMISRAAPTLQAMIALQRPTA